MSQQHSLSRRALVTALVLTVVSACSPESVPDPTQSLSPSFGHSAVPTGDAAAALDAVLSGNAQGIAAAPSLVPPGVPLAPFVEARLYAIANIAMHDALNAIVPRYDRYADDGPIDPSANLAAAVLTAAHDAIVGADPGATAATDTWYATAIAPFTGEPGYAAGVTVGQRVAAAILANRATDGTAGGGIGPYTPGTNPGDYQFTSPFDGPPFNGFADASLWGATVTPFVVASTSQFRAKPPYHAANNSAAVLTKQYTKDFNEVKALGCDGCTARTADQTEIALFWLENSPTGWNRIALIAADQKNLDAWETARLMALLQMGEFDSYATNLESKYYYIFWRPVTAIALAGTDGNPNTSTQPGWQVLAFPTPPVPDYPSAHSGAGGTAAVIINKIVPGNPKITTTSGSLPGPTRSFKNVDAAAEENADSRVYVGFHFRHATEVGLSQGRDVGAYIVKNALRPVH
jgi:hypothetical protein